MILPLPVDWVHYPGNLAAVRSWFPDDAACLDSSVVVSDAVQSYSLAIADTFGHKRFNVKYFCLPAHGLLPGVHRVASLLKCWLASTHQSGGFAEHLQAYLDEFTFPFNLRHARALGLLFLRLLEAPCARILPVEQPGPAVASEALARLRAQPWLRPADSRPISRVVA